MSVAENSRRHLQYVAHSALDAQRPSQTREKSAFESKPEVAAYSLLKAYVPPTTDNPNMNTESLDTELIALLDRIGQQDEVALKALYDRTSSRLFGLALRILGQREWAEDVLQESFLAIWRLASDYRASLSPPMAWMGMIVRSRCLDLLRRRQADRSQLTQVLDDEYAETLEGDSPNPLDSTQASQQAFALHQCLGRLENRQREVVSLAYLRDLSHSELALQLRVPLGTVKTWIRRGLDQLRSCMARYA
jgi:RNA polymerase sigma-70 factor (ECF subfamily)